MAGPGCPEWGQLPSPKGRRLWRQPVSCPFSVAHPCLHAKQ